MVHNYNTIRDALYDNNKLISNHWITINIVNYIRTEVFGREQIIYFLEKKDTELIFPQQKLNINSWIEKECGEYMEETFCVGGIDLSCFHLDSVQVIDNNIFYVHEVEYYDSIYELSLGLKQHCLCELSECVLRKNVYSYHINPLINVFSLEFVREKDLVVDECMVQYIHTKIEQDIVNNMSLRETHNLERTPIFNTYNQYEQNDHNTTMARIICRVPTVKSTYDFTVMDVL
tara:strand:+ start:265 stop:960 length:696 start_codon:yes stop_codon:yes gene_type:complete